MRRSRSFLLLGPAGVLYLVADLAAAAGGLSVVGWAVACCAVACALAPLWLQGRFDLPGSHRVAALGVSSGVGLLLAVEPGVPSLITSSFGALGAAGAGIVVLDLAASVPDAPRALGRRRATRALSTLFGAAAAAAGVLAEMPAFRISGELVLVPAHFGATPALFALGASGVALGLRGLRRRLGSGPEALAANAWALMGLAPAVAAGAAGLALAGGLWIDSWPSVRVILAVTVVVLVGSHLALLDSRHRLSAGATAQQSLTALLALGAIAALAVALEGLVPDRGYRAAVLAALSLVVGVLLYRALAAPVRRLVSPWRGRLLDAVEGAVDDLGSAASLEDAARAVLAPLRAASGSLDADPRLFTSDPPREARIDAARQPHVRPHPVPGPLAEWFAAHPGEVVVRAALEDKVVRRPDLRALVDVLVAFDALCAVPLRAGDEVEGVLLVPRGRRRSTPSLEELAALERLGGRLAALVSLVSARDRAARRASEERGARDRVEERLEALEEEIERLQADGRVLRAGRGASRLAAPAISYSGPMRELERRIDDAAPLDVPVLLVAEGGLLVDQVARRIHERSGRGTGPFVVVDCASVRPEDSLAALSGADGDDPQPGWLRLASSGTLLLADVPAMAREAQQCFAEALATREVRPLRGHGAHPIDVRVIATSRVNVDALVEDGAFDPDLGRWLSRSVLRVPPLRERPEDVPSLVLLAIDRACRVHGRAVVGIEQPALDVLLAYGWPGNQRELQHVIDRAVVATEGPQIRCADLPPLGLRAPEEPEPDPFAGTYAELERSILRHALERARGNKSEAARMLGLKRTTFFDKLRRHGLDGTGQGGADHAAGVG